MPTPPADRPGMSKARQKGVEAALLLSPCSPMSLGPPHRPIPHSGPLFKRRRR